MAQLPLVVVFLSSSAEASPRCGTPWLLEARNAGWRLAVQRPQAAGFVDSAIYPIRVHYRREDGATRAQDLVLPAAELSWQIEVEQMGWPAPPPDDGAGGDDRYDLYLTDEGTSGGAYTTGSGPDVTPGDQWYSVPSYIALDDRGISDADMTFFVAHELNHALQYTIDAWEYRVFPWESTAEAIANLVDDANDLYFSEAWDFNRLPFESILFDGYADEVTAYDQDSDYEYGGIVFADFLEERYGSKDGTTLLRLWDALAQSSREQEPDFLDGLAVLNPSAATAAAVYTEFALWRMFSGTDDDGAHFEEGGLWDDRGTVQTEGNLALDELDGAALSPGAAPYELGASYWRVALADGTDDTLHAEVAGDAAVQWGLVWAVWPAGGGPALTGSTLGAVGGPAVVDIPLAGGIAAMIGVVNGGRPDLEAEERNVERASFTLNLARVPLPDPTTDPPPTTAPHGTTAAPGPVDEDPPEVAVSEPPAGCGCATGTGSSGLLLAVGLLTARRRH